MGSPTIFIVNDNAKVSVLMNLLYVIVLEDTLAAFLLHSQSSRMKSTVTSKMNLVWTCSNSPFCSKYSVPFSVCLSVVFSESAGLLCSNGFVVS